jgi:hypothetical protein
MLIRYTARGTVSLERLAQNEGGDFLYTFTQACSDGTTGIQLSLLERFEKLAPWVRTAAGAPGAGRGWLGRAPQAARGP